MDSILKVSQVQFENLKELIDSSSDEGHTFLKRFKAQYIKGDNRFDQPGEALFFYMRDDQLLGICGLNIDPYLKDPRVGRVRHLYVMPDFRRMKIGKSLLYEIEREAKKSFRLLTLRTFDQEASNFYLAQGYSQDEMIYSATHFKFLDDTRYLPENYLDKLESGEYELRY